MWQALKQAAARVQLSSQGRKIVGTYKGTTFAVEEAGAALNGRTRRLIIGQSLDDYETKQVHPLWHSWLNHRGELPSEQDIENYDRQQALVAQRVQDMSSASSAFPVSSTPSQPLQDDKVEAASKLRSKRSNAAVRTPWTKGAEEEKPEPPKQTIGAGAGLSVESVMQSEEYRNLAKKA